MEPYKLGEMEQRLADLIWEHAPIGTRALTELCSEVFDWKRTTTYTMLKRLTERKLFENRNGTVIVIMKKADFHAAQGEQFLSETFGGSLPQFVAAFTRRNKLSNEEINELQQMIDAHREE